MENLKNIISELQGYRHILNMDELHDDMLMDCATRIFISQNIQSDRKRESNNNKEIKVKNPTAPATEGQQNLLRKLGFKEEQIKMITKGEAAILINERIQKKGGR